MTDAQWFWCTTHERPVFVASSRLPCAHVGPFATCEEAEDWAADIQPDSGET